MITQPMLQAVWKSLRAEWRLRVLAGLGFAPHSASRKARGLLGLNCIYQSQHDDPQFRQPRTMLVKVLVSAVQ